MEDAVTRTPTPTVQKRGFLIALEGPDCAGKTTIAKRLEREFGCVYTKRPDRTTVTGQILDSFLHKRLAFSQIHEDNERAAQCLFAANNHEGRFAIVKSLLVECRPVVMDRYIPSGDVYHSVTINQDARAYIEALNVGMPKPDVTIVLEVDPEVAAKRRADYGTERNDSVELQKKVGEEFRAKYSGKATFVNANRTHDEVYADVVAALKPWFGLEKLPEVTFY